MRMGFFQIALAAVLMGLAGRAVAQDSVPERRYYISEQRSYGSEGSARTQAVVSRRTNVASDGSRTHRFYASSAFAYDSIVGTLALPTSPQLVATLRASPDRRSLTGNDGSVATVMDAAALGARRDGGYCGARTERVVLPLPSSLVAADNVSVEITTRPVDGVCQISWSTADLAIANADGARRAIVIRGVALSDRGAELIASHTAFAGQGTAGAIAGHRGVFLLDQGREWRRYAALVDLPVAEGQGFAGRRPALTVENAATAFDSARAAATASLVETAVLAYVEAQVNPLPVIIGAFFVVDTVSTVFVNAAGAGIMGVNALLPTPNATAQRIGSEMLAYPGVIGGAIEATARHFGGETAGDVAGLAYATVTVFTPAGATRAIDRAFATAAVEHMLTRGVTGGGQLGNIMIDLGIQSQNVSNWLSRTQLGAQYLDQIVDWIAGGQSNSNSTALDLAGQQAGSLVSPTPNARDAMTDLEFAEFLRQITDPRSPFNQTTNGDFLESTGGLSDVVIAGALAFRLFDHAVQDGDIVSLSVTGNGRTVLAATVTLTNAGQIFNPGVGSGLAVITVTALNLGDLVPNTGAVTVTSPILSGNGTQIYNLQVGERGVLRVLVLGRRARGG